MAHLTVEFKSNARPCVPECMKTNGGRMNWTVLQHGNVHLYVVWTCAGRIDLHHWQ